MAADADDELGNIPRYVLFRNRKVRVTRYEKGALRPFHIVDTDDSQRAVSRDQITFLPENKK